MIRSTKTTLKYSNANKLTTLEMFRTEFKRVTQIFIDKLWEMEKVPPLLPKEITSSVDTWLSARAVQCCAKQASGIVRGTRKKQKQRIYTYNQLVKEGQFKHARKLKKTIDKVKITKPEIKNINPELDSRFVKIDLENETSFDGWLTISNIGNKLKIQVPFKKHEQFNELIDRKGKIKGGVRLGKCSATFMFEMPENIKENGETIGIDIGIKNVVTLSNGQESSEDIHGWNLEKIQQKISKKKKGSKGFKKCQDHRKNHINMVINKVNFSNVSKIRLEKIKNLRRGKRTNRYMSHWTYTAIFDKLKMISEDLGVQVEEINPTYTSQRCSKCGWTRKRNRKGKQFVCNACGFTCDADVNGSRNISLTLPEIKRKYRRKQINRKGFYWLADGQECIVPDVQKTDLLIFQ